MKNEKIEVLSSSNDSNNTSDIFVNELILDESEPSPILNHERDCEEFDHQQSEYQEQDSKIKTSELLKLFSSKNEDEEEEGCERKEETNSGIFSQVSDLWQNPFQEFKEKKIKELNPQNELMLSKTGLITQLPQINEEIEREYNTEK